MQLVVYISASSVVNNDRMFMVSFYNVKHSMTQKNIENVSLFTILQTEVCSYV